MPSVDVFNLENEKVGTIDLAEEVFGQDLREDLISEVVRCQRARMRKGCASTKTRGDVSGTGAKPFRQKRTGRARQGTRRAPHHAGGGVAFGPHPRSYAFRIPKKVRRRAMCSALSQQARDARLKVVRDFALGEIKTRKLAAVLDGFGLKRAMLVDGKDNKELRLSARNLEGFVFRPDGGINLVELLRFENLVISESSIKRLEEELKR
ncbi:MAG: 50S ribosomal protein L4 [Deltaproteobacteria bacterium]|nr:50S ribosomal protein L4 [Deltaproteobacteria bacterium]